MIFVIDVHDLAHLDKIINVLVEISDWLRVQTSGRFPGRRSAKEAQLSATRTHIRYVRTPDASSTGVRCENPGSKLPGRTVCENPGSKLPERTV